MATIKQTLDEILTLDGAMCASVVDSTSGMMLGSVGSGIDLEVAAAGNTEGYPGEVQNDARTRIERCGRRHPDHVG